MNTCDSTEVVDSITGRFGRQLDELTLVRGHVLVELFDKNGNRTEVRAMDNLIVTVGKNLVADNLLASPTLGKPTHMELGTGTVAPAAGDTALGTVIASSRVALTSKTRAANVVTLVGDWAAGTATNTAISEAGVFDAATAGNMPSRATFTAINKGASDTLKITWTYTFA